MQMNVNVQNLQAILKSIAPGVGSGKLAVTLSHAGFSGNKVMTYNGVFGVMHTDSIEGEFALDHNKFYSLLTTYDEEYISVEFDEQRKRFLMSNGKGSKISLSYMAIEDFPFFTLQNINWNENIDENFIEALKIALITTGNDQTTGAFWGIYFASRIKDGKDTPYIISSDGSQRLTYLEIDTPIKNVIVPRTFIEKIVSEGKPDAVAYDGRFVYVRYNKVVFFSNTLGAIYQDFSKLYSNLPECKSINPQLILFAKRCAILGCSIVHYKSEDKLLTAQTMSNDVITERAELPLKDFAIHTTYLIESLAVAKAITCAKIINDMMVFTFDIPGMQMVSLMEGV